MGDGALAIGTRHIVAIEVVTVRATLSLSLLVPSHFSVSDCSSLWESSLSVGIADCDPITVVLRSLVGCPCYA